MRALFEVLKPLEERLGQGPCVQRPHLVVRWDLRELELVDEVGFRFLGDLLGGILGGLVVDKRIVGGGSVRQPVRAMLLRDGGSVLDQRVGAVRYPVVEPG